jgi:twitching motility protein PilT
MSSLLGIVIDACNDTDTSFTDLILHQGYPVVAQTPAGNVALPGTTRITDLEMREFADMVCQLSNLPSDSLDRGAIKAAIDLTSASVEGGLSEQSLRVRFTIVRSSGGKEIAAVVRRIKQRIPTLAECGFPKPAMPLLRNAGLVLLTGPTKQGKSTTAAAMLQEIRDSRHGHIVTIEDPIEYVIAPRPDHACPITSREVGVDVNSYLEGAEDALRLNPTVVMIGEIRDAETARAALNLGESGHLVISTMQATTVEGALFKLWALTANHPGAHASIASCLKGVVRTALIPSADRRSFVPAYEFMLCEGEFAKAISENPSPQAASFRSLLEAGQYPAHGKSLNSFLKDLCASKLISEASVREYSNNIKGLGII